MTSMHLVLLSSKEAYARSIIEPVSTELNAQNVEWSISTDHHALNDTQDIVFLIGYDKIVDIETITRLKGRLVVFHSSDLPKGRGWAPIYTTISSQASIHTVTLCYVNQSVDSGNILVKARILVPPYYTAAMLRSVGQKVIGKLISKYTLYFKNSLPVGLKQKGKSSYVPRRRPEDARMEPGQPLDILMPHILASEHPNAAYIIYRGEKFRLIAIPERQDIHSEFTVEEYFNATHERTINLSF